MYYWLIVDYLPFLCNLFQLINESFIHSFHLKLINKTPTRIPESMFTTFNVLPHTRDTKLDGWKVDKLGELLQANQFDMQARRGNAHQQGILDGFEYAFGGERIRIRSVDAGIAITGKPTGFPCPFDTPDLTYGISTMLVNNLWGVNYIMWYPFEEGDENLLFRYVIEVGKE